VEGVSAADQGVPSAVDAAEKAKRGEFVVAPLPIVNPTLENGLAVLGGYLYRLDPADTKTPPSVTGFGGMKTSNGTWAVTGLQTLHLAHDAVRLTAVAAYGDINYAFFGIGQDAGNAGVSIELNQTGPVGMAEGLYRIRPRWYLGARYLLLKMRVTSGDVEMPGGPTLPAADAELRTAGLGPRLDYDSRDSTFYPRRGAQMQAIVGFYGKGIGGQREYQSYQAWINHYHALGPRNVLAWHASACAVEGSVPFYDLCLLGKNQDLRGYPTGQYRDRSMLAAQAEWRTELWWRIGAAAYFGGGAVAPTLTAVTWKETLPGGGAGLRFTLADRNHVNLRVDYAWGKNSSALYVGVAEAF
jgi:hypothetical protein